MTFATLLRMGTVANVVTTSRGTNIAVYLSYELPDWDAETALPLRALSAAGVGDLVLTWLQVATMLASRGGSESTVRGELDRLRFRIGCVDFGVVDCDCDAARNRLIDELTGRMGAAVSLGATRVCVAGGPATNRNFADVVTVLRDLAAPAKRLGLRFCARNAFDSSVEQLNDLHVLFRDARSPGLLLDLDVGDFQRAAVNPCDAILSFSGRIGQVRLVDLRGRTRVPLGQGDVNVPAIVRALGDERFDGPIVLPADQGRDAFDRLEMDRRYLAELGL